MTKLLGVSRSTLYKMEAAGAPFPAGKCNYEWLVEWLKENPNFRPRCRGTKAAPAPSAKPEKAEAPALPLTWVDPRKRKSAASTTSWGLVSARPATTRKGN